MSRAASPGFAGPRPAASRRRCSRSPTLMSSAAASSRSKAAFDFYRRAAIAGHGEAENAIGNFHLFGAHGLKEDPAEAARWFRRAAERNNPAGAFNLGTLLWRGRGVAQNKIDAYRWLATAGLYGDDAMINRVTGVLFQLEEQMSEDEVAKAQAAVPDWENRLYRPPTTMESLVEP